MSNRLQVDREEKSVASGRTLLLLHLLFFSQEDIRTHNVAVATVVEAKHPSVDVNMRYVSAERSRRCPSEATRWTDIDTLLSAEV